MGTPWLSCVFLRLGLGRMQRRKPHPTEAKEEDAGSRVFPGGPGTGREWGHMDMDSS